MTLADWIDQRWLTEVEFLQYMAGYKPSNGTTPTIPKIGKKVFSNEILGSAITVDNYEVPGGKMWFNVNIYAWIVWGGASAYVSPLIYFRPANSDQRFLGGALDLYSKIWMCGTVPWTNMRAHASQNIDDYRNQDFSAAGGSIDTLVPLPKITLTEGMSVQITMDGGALDYIDYIMIVSEMEA